MRSLLNAARRLYDWVLAWADHPFALVALFLLAFAESSFFPVPPDVLLIAMAVGAPRKSFVFAGWCTVGSVLGGLAGYAIGALAWQGLSPFFFSYVPGFTPEKFAVIQDLYRQHGALIVFTAGFSPLPYKIFTIASGVMGQSLLPFVLASLVSRGARFFLVGGLVFAMGARAKDFIDRHFNTLATLFAAMLVGAVVLLKWVF